MRVCVYGGRDYCNSTALYRCLSAFHQKLPITTLYEGGATGADRFARLWAFAEGVLVLTVHAAWGLHGPSAGPIRNGVMASLVEVGIEFPGGRGTANMRSRLQQRRIPIYVPRSDYTPQLLKLDGVE